MIVCHCAVVTDRDVVDTVKAGARTTGQVCRATGAGRSCGTCILSVRQLLGQHCSCAADESPEQPTRWTAAALQEVGRAAS